MITFLLILYPESLALLTAFPLAWQLIWFIFFFTCFAITKFPSGYGIPKSFQLELLFFFISII